MHMTHQSDGQIYQRYPCPCSCVHVIDWIDRIEATCTRKCPLDPRAQTLEIVKLSRSYQLIVAHRHKSPPVERVTLDDPVLSETTELRRRLHVLLSDMLLVRRGRPSAKRALIREEDRCRHVNDAEWRA